MPISTFMVYNQDTYVVHGKAISFKFLLFG